MDEPPSPIPSEEVDVTISKKTSTTKAKQTTATRSYVDPPIFSFSVNNPVNYLRKWWYRVISREGIDVRFRIHPVTAFAALLTIASLGFGVGRITIPAPIIKLIPQLAPTPTPDLWKESAFSGVLQVNSAGKFYLVTQTTSEAVTLEVPENIALASFVGKRVFASGRYNMQTGVLVVTDARKMEVLLRVAPIQLMSPSPSLHPSPESTVIPE